MPDLARVYWRNHNQRVLLPAVKATKSSIMGAMSLPVLLADGVAKNRTVIGSNAFIGSSSTLVAPVEVGEGALVAAGSVITSNVPGNALALGRAWQTTKEDRADATRQKLRELHIQKLAEQ